jgi:hypothetical protein
LVFTDSMKEILTSTNGYFHTIKKKNSKNTFAQLMLINRIVKV